MKKISRLTAFVLALLMLLQTAAFAEGGVALDDFDYSNYEGMLMSALDERGPLVDEGGELTDAAKYIPEQKDLPVYASTETQALNVLPVGSEETVQVSLPEKGMVRLTVAANGGQWQVQVLNTWVAISGETGVTCDITYAKVRNLFDLNGGAKVRWLSADGQSVSQIAAIELNTSDAPAAQAAPVQNAVVYADDTNDTNDANDDTVRHTYNIVIKYVFENGTVAADPYTANLAKGSSFSQIVTFPTVMGYLPYVDGEQANEYALYFTSIDADVTITVTYKPTNVNYTVIYHQQNIDNDEYTEVYRETLQGLTKSQVPEITRKYEGFYSLVYERPEIAADGSTIIDVYYDRYYYLMNFDLDGGYGVDPIYARYGAKIGDVGTPTKKGYTFEGWDNPLPSTMPAENTVFKAQWEAGEASFTVVFWYENANDDEYSFAGTYKPTNVASGTLVNSDTYKNQSFAGRDNAHFTYNSEKAETVEVKGDGSTVLNVYFTRNTYTLKFRKDTSEWWESAKWETVKTITAKYGEDIHGNFPIKEGNKTIWWDVPAGCESFKSGTQLGSIDTMPGENITFDYSSADSGAVLWYYIETLDGETGTYTHGGKNFKLYKQIDIQKSGVLTYTEEFHDITGFTQWWSDPSFNKMEKGGTTNTVKKNNYLCYTRNSYNLSFYNYNAVVSGKGGKVQYEAPLKDYYFEPDYPTNLEPNAYKFAGWYTTAGCYDGSAADMSKMTMPATDLMLYAKWVPVTHTVKFYLTETSTDIYKPANDKEASFEVEHGDNIAEEYVNSHLTREAMNTAEPKPNGDYNFVVWYYYDENGDEQYFDPTVPIRQDMVLYGKWSSNTLKQYTVRYVLQGTDTKVADDLTGSGLAGTTKTFDAKGGTDLYPEYQEGYFPTVKSSSLILDIEKDELVLTFEYVRAPAVPYTVKYINTETGDSIFDGVGLVDDKVVSDNVKAVVTETFKVIPGYMPDAYQKRLVVTADGENILYFYYTKDSHHAYYKITHYTENLATDAQGNTTWTEYASSQAKGDIGETYTADAMTIPGFTFDKMVEGTLESGKLTEDGLELKLYYRRNKYPYQVRYLEEGTGKVLSTPKNSTGKYQQVISEKALDITDYVLVSDSPATLTIRIEEGDEAKLNVITFYYKQKEATIKYVPVGPEGLDATTGEPNPTVAGSVLREEETVKILTGTAQGSTAAANTPGYRFVGWYEDAECTKLISTDEKFVPTRPDSTIVDGVATGGKWPETGLTYYAKFEATTGDLTIIKKGYTHDDASLDPNQSFLFYITDTKGFHMEVVICGNGHVTIKDLPAGTYTVREEQNWSWRYTPEEASQITTVTGGETAKVTFTNNRTNGKWLDGNDYCENEWKNNWSN